MQETGERSDYNYVFGVFKSRETELLDESRIESLLKSAGFEEAVPQIPECPFADELRKLKSESGIDSGISREFKEINGFLQLNSPSAELKNLVFIPWDFFNLKVAILSKIKDKQIENLYGPEGNVSIEQLKISTEDMNFSNLPQDIYDALQQAWISYYETDKNTQAFEFTLDREKNLLLTKTALRTDSKELINFFKAVEELKLGELIIRAKEASIGWDLVTEGLKKSSLADNFKDIYPNQPQEWQGYIGSLRDSLLKRILYAFSQKQNISEITLVSKQELNGYLERWKYYPPSIEYAYYFLARKFADLYNIRLILLGKLTGISTKILKKRILNVCV
ncbi:MAG: V-type ATPase subunit [Spirochaetales bacterium]|nr:V-type ATPase subunit [Spirochaetales bacterium]